MNMYKMSTQCYSYKCYSYRPCGWYFLLFFCKICATYKEKFYGVPSQISNRCCVYENIKGYHENYYTKAGMFVLIWMHFAC